MKRVADCAPAPALARPLKRQPQTSCDSCRQKKLKCDRAEPCAACHTRGLTCSLKSQHDTTKPEDSGILRRIAALEQAVFSRSLPPSQAEDPPSSCASPYLVRPQTTPVTEEQREGRQISQFLDVAYSRAQNGINNSYTEPDIRIAKTLQDSLASSFTGGGSPVWLPPHADTKAMLHDFVKNAYHLMPILHLISTQSTFDQIYSQINSKNMDNICHADISLLFSICAASALFWNPTVPFQHRFESDQVAILASGCWNRSALDLLAQSQRLGAHSLQAAQATAILAYLAYNIHGPSTQFFHLHTASVTACRNLRIHVTDSPGHDSSTDDAAQREIKRRLWWHVAANDWMLGLNGGPLDGTYTIHPRQFSVVMPRNLNDAELAFDSDEIAYPPHVVTSTSCFLQVIQLAKISRAVIDFYNSDDGATVDKASNERVLALDELFGNALARFPPPLALGFSIPDGAPRFLCLQRATIQLGFHSRRARLHRRALVHQSSSKGRQNASPIDEFQQSRDICVRSARTVLDISMSLLARSLPHDKRPVDPVASQHPEKLDALHHEGHESCPSFPVHRLCVVVNHLFRACAILAFEFSRRITNSVTNIDDDLRQTLIHACRLLTAASEENTVAADIVRGMRSVFDRYRICGVDEVWQPTVAIDKKTQDDAAQGFRWPNGEPTTGSEPFGLGTQDTANSGGMMLNSGTYELDQADLDNFFVSSYFNDSWDHIVSGLDGYCGP